MNLKLLFEFYASLQNEQSCNYILYYVVSVYVHSNVKEYQGNGACVSQISLWNKYEADAEPTILDFNK